MFRTRAAFALTAVTAGLLVAVAPAQAADTFVDDDTGNDGNLCTATAMPCLTVGAGVAKAGPGDTTFVDGGTYAESVALTLGKSLFEQEFNLLDGDSEAIIDGAGLNAINVPVFATAGTIRGFTLRSTNEAVALSGPALVTGNLFDSTGNGSRGITSSATGASIVSNVFTDDANVNESRIGISVTAGSVSISSNDFSNLSTGVSLSNGAPMESGNVSLNEFTGTHEFMGSEGIAINVAGNATPTLVGNHIHMPNLATQSVGVNIFPLSGAIMRGNRIFGHSVAVSTLDTTAAVSLFSDVIKDSAVSGLVASDTGSGGGNVTATNVTFSGNAPTDVTLNDTLLTLNSAIVEDPITANGTATCAISFSRGPTTTMGGNGCANFQTTAAPGFAGDGYHLLTTSPLIDLGDPAAPMNPDVQDVDGDPRATDENCDGVTRRNIGADEIPLTCAGPVFAPVQAPATAPQPAPKKKRKCKKNRKGAEAAKKCKRKKRR